MDNGSKIEGGGAGGSAVTGSTKAAGRDSSFQKWMKANDGGGYGAGPAPF